MIFAKPDPRALAGGAAQLDDSRLGNHLRPIDPSELKKQKHGIVILGLADDTGVRAVGGRPGAAEGPAAVRAKLCKFTLGAPIIPIYDLGDLKPAGRIEDTHAQASALVRAALEAGHAPVVLGGGHDLGFPHALGLLEARAGRRCTFLNIDAHLDVRPTPNGITSGSPWYLLREHALFQRSKSRVEEFGLQPHCNAHSLVAYATRHKFGLHWLGDIRARKKEAAAQFRSLLKARGVDSLLVSLDIDCVAHAEAPGCSAPQTLGFSAAEVIRMSFYAGAVARVRSFGLFELSPPLDRDGQTAALAAHCVHAFLSGRGAWGRKNSASFARGIGAKL